jgi:NAD-dependent DNA ligase
MAKKKGAAPAAVTIDIVGKNVAITGKLVSMTREEAADALDAMGAHVSDSISKHTHYLFAGERAGSKLARAQALGVPVLGEAELCVIVGRPFEPRAPEPPQPPAVTAAEVGLVPEFAGKTWVVTGALSTMKRDQVAAELAARGARVTDSVSKNTHCLPGGRRRARLEARAGARARCAGALRGRAPRALRRAPRRRPGDPGAQEAAARGGEAEGRAAPRGRGKTYVITGTLATMKRRLSGAGRRRARRRRGSRTGTASGTASR